VRYGIEPAPEPGLIEVVVTVGQGAISLQISNPLPAAVPHSGGNGIALDNIRRRLALLYGEQARLVNSVVDGRYQLKLTLPIGSLACG
jgi:two-component system sensor histidine kinase AlgZ